MSYKILRYLEVSCDFCGKTERFLMEKNCIYTIRDIPKKDWCLTFDKKIFCPACKKKFDLHPGTKRKNV